jgi:fructose-1-phosphate kinase PfkB-like protein
MDRIVTLTLNPAIDSSSEAEAVRPTHKIRTGLVKPSQGEFEALVGRPLEEGEIEMEARALVETGASKCWRSPVGTEARS